VHPVIRFKSISSPLHSSITLLAHHLNIFFRSKCLLSKFMVVRYVNSLSYSQFIAMFFSSSHIDSIEAVIFNLLWKKKRFYLFFFLTPTRYEIILYQFFTVIIESIYQHAHSNLIPDPSKPNRAKNQFPTALNYQTVSPLLSCCVPNYSTIWIIFPDMTLQHVN